MGTITKGKRPLEDSINAGVVATMEGGGKHGRYVDLLVILLGLLAHALLLSNYLYISSKNKCAKISTEEIILIISNSYI